MESVAAVRRLSSWCNDTVMCYYVFQACSSQSSVGRCMCLLAKEWFTFSICSIMPPATSPASTSAPSSSLVAPFFFRFCCCFFAAAVGLQGFSDRVIPLVSTLQQEQVGFTGC